jgi:hypothetical protein
MQNRHKEDKLFSNEAKVLHKYRELLSSTAEEKIDRNALEELTDKYKNLLEQSRFLTWISGRLERKLHKANQEMFAKNNEMQTTLNELSKAKAGKRAYAIIYFIAIVLFVMEESFIEPLIDVFGGGVWYGILIKLVIVLLLKSSESFIEEQLIRNRLLKSKKKGV